MKIIKFTDYIKVNPMNGLKVSKKIQNKISDHLLERSEEEGKGLLVTYDLSHSARRINSKVFFRWSAERY